MNLTICHPYFLPASSVGYFLRSHSLASSLSQVPAGGAGGLGDEVLVSWGSCLFCPRHIFRGTCRYAQSMYTQSMYRQSKCNLVLTNVLNQSAASATAPPSLTDRHAQTPMTSDDTSRRQRQLNWPLCMLKTFGIRHFHCVSYRDSIESDRSSPECTRTRARAHTHTDLCPAPVLHFLRSALHYRRRSFCVAVVGVYTDTSPG